MTNNLQWDIISHKGSWVILFVHNSLHNTYAQNERCMHVHGSTT